MSTQRKNLHHFSPCLKIRQFQKDFLVSSILLKKRTKKIQLNYYDSFRSFFGRIEDTKKTFRNQLTFKTEKILVLYFDPRFIQVLCFYIHIILATVWLRSFFFYVLLIHLKQLVLFDVKANKRIIVVCIATQHQNSLGSTTYITSE